MADRIRVKHKETGHIHSIAKSRFDKAIWDKVEALADNPDGSPIAPEYPKAAKKAASQSPTPAASDQPGQTAASDKENS